MRTACLHTGKTYRSAGRRVIPALPSHALEQILSGEEESLTFATKVNGETLIFAVEAITLDRNVAGTIISCNQMMRKADPALDLAHKRYMQGFTARYTLDRLAQDCPDLSAEIERAKLYAQSRHPLWIEYHGDSEEVRRFCQGIHNYSVQKDGPYVEVDLLGMDETEQLYTLFGDRQNGAHSSALTKASLGTLVLLNIDRLTPYAQLMMMNTLRHRNNGQEEILQILQVRLLCCSQRPLAELWQNRILSEELFYSFCTLRLYLPPLNSRVTDLGRLIDYYVQKYNTQYTRYHILSNEARQTLLNYPWHGGAMQLEAFIDRLLLGVSHRTVSGEYVQALLSELYPEQKNLKETAAPSFEEENIRKTLQLYSGNRSLTARALGISTSTLWRRMQRFGIRVQSGSVK